MRSADLDVSLPPLLQIEGWGVRRGRWKVLAHIDMELPGSGVVALMGPAGTGKSTLLSAIAGHPLAHSEQWGSIFLQGQPLHEAPLLPALAQQQPRELGFSVLENLLASLREREQASALELRQRIEQRLQDLQLHALSAQLQTRVIDLPRGLARQVAILRAAFSGSPLLLIDEPTSDLPESEAAPLLELVQRLGQTHCCLVTLHNQQQARHLASRIILLAGGYVQVDASTAAFFRNDGKHPVLEQFLRTGSCSVPAADATADQLAEEVALPPAHNHLEYPTLPSVSMPSTSLRRGPTGFHWLLPGRLAGCPMPGVVFAADHDLALLRGMGVTTLINLTEQPMPAELLERHSIRSYHMGIEDRRAPPLLWLKLLLAKMDSMMRNNEVLAVHCLAGLGRTGLVLAAWLVREGLTAAEALRRLRMIEPGFVQSQEQEDLLKAFEENLLIRAS
jgi:atypical dual specificity phosphatase